MEDTEATQFPLNLYKNPPRPASAGLPFDEYSRAKAEFIQKYLLKNGFKTWITRLELQRDKLEVDTALTQEQREEKLRLIDEKIYITLKMGMVMAELAFIMQDYDAKLLIAAFHIQTLNIAQNSIQTDTVDMTDLEARAYRLGMVKLLEQQLLKGPSEV